MNQQSRLSPDLLLQHEPFVRAVVRGLLSDEDRVQDVVQETWLAALCRPPRQQGSLRGWLARVASNLARDSHRATSRRRRREQEVARAERIESVEATQERLEVQREVVEGVLALGEPYRSVVLLRYYQDLSSTEIAGRLGRSASTVRSQLSRAHESLRVTLDAKCRDDRSSWAGLALPLVRGGRSELSTSGLAAQAKLGAGLVGIAAAAFFVVPRVLATAEPPPALLRAVTPLGPVAESTGRAPVQSGSSWAVARRPAPAVGVALEPAQELALEDLSLQELNALAVQTMRTIERSLLTPNEKLVGEQADLLALPGTGVSRILSGSGTRIPLERAVLKRGGGTYFSFEHRDHSYNLDPDLSFRDGRFLSGFAGIDMGLVLEVGDVPLTALTDQGNPLPAGVPEELADSWELLWQDLTLDDAAHRSPFRERTRELQRGLVPSGTSSTYLVRAYKPGAHDYLVAFRPLEFDARGCTFAWRILREWPVPGPKRAPSGPKDEYLEVPDGPAWLAELSLEEAMDFLQRIRSQARQALLGVPTERKERYLEVVEQDATSWGSRAGFARILHRGRFDPLADVRGGGACFSFLTQSNEYGQKSELGLDRERFSSSFAGLLLDVGEVPSARLADVMSGEVPKGLSKRERRAWDFLWNVRAEIVEVEGRERRALSERNTGVAKELGLWSSSVPAVVGHTYLLRSVLFPLHDHLVVFTVLGENEAGLTLAWRILRSWPVDGSVDPPVEPPVQRPVQRPVQPPVQPPGGER